MAGAETHAAIRGIWSAEAAKIIGRLTRMVRDVGLAEDLAQGALVAALERWPVDGVPEDPGAWLMTSAKRRAVEQHGAEPEATAADDVGDDVLRLVFLACHPVLSLESRVALTLRLIAGLAAEDIARAFGAQDSAIRLRIARATKTLADAKVPFEVPRGAELEDRLACVLQVIYLIFNEGYAAAGGDDAVRLALCEDAMRLGLMVGKLMPNEPEAHGLLALMALHLSRAGARLGPEGEPVQLLEQDRAHWDQGMIARGLAALERAESGGPRGPYTIQAAISACHARARAPEDTEWPRIAMLYGKLAEIVQSPVVEINRAVAVAMAYGPAKGLEIVDALMREPALADYHLLPSARADLLAKLGRYDEARAEFERAARLTRDDRERELLLASAAACPR